MLIYWEILKNNIKHHRSHITCLLYFNYHTNNIINPLLCQVSDSKCVVVHWDGKILPEWSGKDNVDRLPVIVNNNGSEQLLGVPKLTGGTGEEVATAVFEKLNEWGLTNHVQGLCCDTTASNMGRTNGACILLEQKLCRNLIYLPCRHHIYELILRTVFEVKFQQTSGPTVPLFSRFQKAWSKRDTSKYKSGIQNDKWKM